MRTADRHTFCWKWEENQNKLFSVPPSETAPNTISLTWCHISTFTLTIPVSRFKAELITLPFRNCQHTIHHYSYNFFPPPSNSTVYSSLFSNFLEIQKNCQRPIVNFDWFSVLPCSSNNCNMLWENKTGLEFNMRIRHNVTINFSDCIIHEFTQLWNPYANFSLYVYQL